MEFIITFLIFLPIMAFHGFIQAWVAHLLGDETAREEGRLTMNPMVHFDLWGTLLMPAIGFVLNQGQILPIGWGRPIPVTASNLQYPRRDELLIAFSGPLANLVLAFLAVLLGKYIRNYDPTLGPLILKFAFTSVFLGLFNLIPFPWLDGWAIIRFFFEVSNDFADQTLIWWNLGLIALLNLTPFLVLLIGLSGLLTQSLSHLANF